MFSPHARSFTPRHIPQHLTLMMSIIADDYISQHEPDEVINRGDARLPYMNRYYLSRKADGPIENIYLHRFLRSDSEEMHNHPWASIGLILSGSYDEVTPDGMLHHAAGDIIVRGPDSFHAITAAQPRTTTLFITGRKVQDWGFLTVDGLIPWQQFRAWKNARIAS